MGDPAAALASVQQVACKRIEAALLALFERLLVGACLASLLGVSVDLEGPALEQPRCAQCEPARSRQRETEVRHGVLLSGMAISPLHWACDIAG